jgi:hypothetical protein
MDFVNEAAWTSADDKAVSGVDAVAVIAETCTTALSSRVTSFTGDPVVELLVETGALCVFDNGTLIGLLLPLLPLLLLADKERVGKITSGTTKIS